MNPRSAERAAVAAMVGATLLWGGTFVAIRDAVATLRPVTLVAARFAAASALYALALALRRRAPTRREWRGGALAGVCMAGGFLLQAIGLRSTSAGSSAFLTCAGSLLAAAWAWLLLGERPSRRLALGLLVALAGAALLSLRGGFALGAGELVTFAGAALFALQVVALARFAPGADALALAGVQALTVALALAPFAGDAPRALAALDGAGRARVAYLVVAGSTIAPWLHVAAQRTLPAGRVGLLLALEPVFALAFALTIGAERFDPRWWAGAALVLAAVVWVEAGAVGQAGARA